MRDLTLADVQVLVHCLPEDMPLKGNVMVSDDDAFDRECEEDIQRQLDAGNEWAWCCVRVVCIWEDWSAEMYLGGCSYSGEAEFRTDAYFDDLQNEALGRLNAEVREAASKLGALS